MTERFVWTGRLEGSWPDGVDGWNRSWDDAVTDLRRAEEILVLDAPSFPWQAITRATQDARFVVRLPDELDAEALAQLLGGPLLSSVTPYDRLLHPSHGIRTALTDRFDLPDVWIPYDDDRADWKDVLGSFLDQDVEGLHRSGVLKPRFNQLVQSLIEELDAQAVSAVVVSGDPAVRAGLLAKPGCEVWRSELLTAEFRPSPDAAVIVLQDGASSQSDRVALFRSGYRQLDPGGQLIVVGFVVDAPDGSANPSIGELVTELHEATGTSLHLESLRSIRWAGEQMTRGVVLRFTSLRLREL